MANKITSQLGKTSLSKGLGKKASNALGLVHSALDVEDGGKLYEFAQWLNTTDFTGMDEMGATPERDVQQLAPLSILHPIGFYDFSAEKTNNYAGFGLKSIQKIPANEDIIQMSLDMGLVSNVIVEDYSAKEAEQDQDDELLKEITGYTETVSKQFFPHDLQKVHQNRLNQHLLLTQQLIMMRRKYAYGTGGSGEFRPSNAMDCLMQSYLQMLPPLQHQTNVACWDQPTLNEVDSQHLGQSFGAINQYYRSVFKNLVDGEGSPYLGKDSLAYEEFLWAFNTASSRHVVLHDHQADQDEKLVLFQMPLLDILNHSLQPNVAILPYVDKLDEKSFLVLKALRDIEPNEQLTISYGELSNIHLAQKYGTTLYGAGLEEQDKRNVVQANYTYGDYQQILYEEQMLKEKFSSELLIPFDEERFMGANLFPNKFEQSLLTRLRLSFLTSRTIMDFGGTEKLSQEVDFKSFFDQFNEDCTLQFMIDSVEQDLKQHLKPKEVYLQRLAELEDLGLVDSVDKLNELNVLRLHINECDIAQKNLDYLIKLRKSS